MILMIKMNPPTAQPIANATGSAMIQASGFTESLSL
jgi:hypothetical protein